MKPIARRIKNKGMTFIEVLVAMVILVTGILGAVAMQAVAMKGSFDAMQRSLASSLAQDIIERMRSNSATALTSYSKNDYGVTLDSKPGNRCNNTVACTPAIMSTNDQYEWELALMGADVKQGTKNAGGLINARACINVSGASNNIVTVVVTWQGRTKLSDGRTAIDGDGNLCGGGSDNKRRQVKIDAFVF